MLNIDLTECACFGVAGNFTGHLEQAGEALDFKGVSSGEGEPKAVFPTYIPGAKNCVPAFLGTFPFDERKIIFPRGEEKIQIEAECAILFSAQWESGRLTSLLPKCFCASNDVSIRRARADGKIVKISEKKNWGPSSKGAGNFIELSGGPSSEAAWKELSSYRISSFLMRGNDLYEYGEDSPVNTYSYFYQKLVDWLLQKINGQKEGGPCEDVHSYLAESGFPKEIFVSVGATRYTPFGQSNFLQAGDTAIVCLYPEKGYSKDDVKAFASGRISPPGGISILRQRVQME